jgi:hypothetical protein
VVSSTLDTDVDPAFDGAFDPTVFDVAERTAFPNGVTLTRLARR